MAIGIDADTEYAERAGIPSGGAGTLSAGGFADFFAGVWVYRPASTTYALTAAGSIIHCQAGAREVIVVFNSAGANLADLNLQIIYNSGGGTGTPFLFTGHTGASFLDEWVYYFIYEDASNNLVGGYILLSDLATAVTNSYANDNAGSQYVNSLTFGCDAGSTARDRRLADGGRREGAGRDGLRQRARRRDRRRGCCRRSLIDRALARKPGATFGA